MHVFRLNTAGAAVQMLLFLMCIDKLLNEPHKKDILEIVKLHSSIIPQNVFLYKS